jgi:hypothetical protein
MTSGSRQMEDAESVARSQRPLSEFIRELDSDEDIKWAGRYGSPRCPGGDEQRRDRHSIETGEPAPPPGQRCLCDSRHRTASQPAQTNPAPDKLAAS